MTAVEYLVSKIASKIYDEYWSNQQDITEYVEEALRIETQQIIASFDSGIENYNDCKIFDGKQYYNETFKK